MTFTVPRAVLDGLGPYGVTQVGLNTNDFAFAVGTASIPVTGLTAPKTDVPATGDLPLPVSGRTAPSPHPRPAYDFKTMPAAFNATVTTDARRSLLGPRQLRDHRPGNGQGRLGGRDRRSAGCGVHLHDRRQRGPAVRRRDQRAGLSARSRAARASRSTPRSSASTTRSGCGARSAAGATSPSAVTTSPCTGGAGSIPFSSLSSAAGTIVPGSDLVLPTTAGNKAFTAPRPAPRPAAHDVHRVSSRQPGSGPVRSVHDRGRGVLSTVGSMTVTPAPKQQLDDEGDRPASVKKGASVKISVTVSTASLATGQVTAKEGSKSPASANLKNNKATITVKGLKPGKHTIKVVYAGDSSTKGSTSKAVTVTVKK